VTGHTASETLPRRPISEHELSLPRALHFPLRPFSLKDFPPGFRFATGDPRQWPSHLWGKGLPPFCLMFAIACPCDLDVFSTLRLNSRKGGLWSRTMKSDNSKRNGKKPLAKPAASKPKQTARPKPEIPPILLEGDETAGGASGPGQRYSLGPAPVHQAGFAAAESGELPESYGTKRLLLAARDPRWLYAHWDLTREQLKEYNAVSIDKHLIVRVYKDEIRGEPVCDVHVHPESRNWFINVPEAGAKYIAELGYFNARRQWQSISTSSPTLTPADTMSSDMSVWFETLPADLQMKQILDLVKHAVKDNVPLMEAIQQLRASGFKGLPDPRRVSPDRWTQAQDQALAELVTMDRVRRIWVGSLEITELIRRQLVLSSQAVSQFSIPSSWSGAVSSFSSPLGGWERRKGFWFNVNAELIIYGATEPDAEVKIGDRVIKLRPDGTFSFRFSLPDGRYFLPAVATSADGTDSRTAALSFSRSTDYKGDVGKHPQDPQLREPSPAHVS